MSICLEMGLDLKTREDVMNLIALNCYSYLCKDPVFVEEVVNAFLEQV